MNFLSRFDGHHLRGNVDKPIAPVPGDYRSNRAAFDGLAPVTDPQSDARLIAPEAMGIGTDEWIFSSSVLSGTDQTGRARRLSVFATRKVTGAFNARTLYYAADVLGLRQIFDPFKSLPTEKKPEAIVVVRDLDDGRFWSAETTGLLEQGAAFAFTDSAGHWNMRQTPPLAAILPYGGAVYVVRENDFNLKMRFVNQKPAITHGKAGRYLNDQIPGFPLLTRYASRTRQHTKMIFTADGDRIILGGLSSSDHQSSHLDRMTRVLSLREFLSYLLKLPDLTANWQWIPLQLSDGAELNLFTVWTSRSDPTRQFNAGFYLSPTGEKIDLGLGDFRVVPRASSVVRQGSLLAPTAWDIALTVPGRGEFALSLKSYLSDNHIPLRTLGTKQDVIEAAISAQGEWLPKHGTKQSVSGTGWVEIVLLDWERLLFAGK